jgi:hypothetical protein
LLSLIEEYGVKINYLPGENVVIVADDLSRVDIDRLKIR